jgi:DNA-binding LacI/PurR family transcriptional regulator
MIFKKVQVTKLSMEYKKVTRKDVAERAGVTETIVSYVINNNRYVAIEKKELVLKAIKELNYRPNNIARALKGKKTNHILFIADHISNEHFGRVIEEMDKNAYEKGYLISLSANRNTEEFVSQVISRNVDGIVISSVSFHEEYINHFLEANIPVVVLMNKDYTALDKRAGKIYTGLYLGAKNCVKHLIDKGRKDIVYIDRVSRRGNFSAMDDLRYKGFYEQLQESGLSFSPNSILTGYKNEDELYEAIQTRIKSGLKIDGVVCRNDYMACVAVSAISDLGLSIPGDISVIGFDNLSISKFVTPHLTTMEIDRKQIGIKVIEMIDKLIAGETVEDIYLSTKLIERSST